MSGPTFSDLSGWSVNERGWSWLDGVCRSPVGLECAPAAFITPVSEPAAALMFAAGLAVLWLWVRHAQL